MKVLLGSIPVRRRVAWFGLGLVAFQWMATASLDHGYNWDEWYHLEGMRRSVERLEMRPAGHIYNGAYFLPGYLVLAAHLVDDLPQIVSEMAHNPGWEFVPERYPTLQRWREDMIRLLSTERYKQEVRYVFVLMTVPMLLWVFLTLLRLFPYRYYEALGAAALVGLSWEINRRSRCIEVDAPMMQFVSLQLFMMACAFSARLRSRALWHVVGMGLAAGLVVACKASGVYAVLLGVLACFFVPFYRGLRDRMVLVAALCGGLAFAVFAVSPFTTIDPIRAVWQQFSTWAGYQSILDTHPFHVEAPWEHLGKVLLWLFGVLPSPRFVPAAVLAAVSLVGFGVLARYRPRFSAVASVYPVATLSTMTALILLQIRNYLQFFPFIAIAFGAGLVFLWRWLEPRPLLRWVAMGLVAGVFVFNSVWLHVADRSVRTATRDSVLAEARAYVRNAKHDFIVSPRAHEALRTTFDELFVCERSGDDLQEPRVLMYYTDHHPFRWRAMSPGYVERTFAPMDANFDWYALWKGRLEHHRIVLMSPENAEGMGVALRRFLRCRRKP